MAAYMSFQPSDFFNVKLWTGNSTTDRAMTGVGFQPDMLWIKGRNEGTDHELQDAVRGSTKYIRPNLTAVEGTETEGVKSFDTDGYTLGNANYWNWTAKTFVGWSWKAGTTTGLSGGTITPSSYSINTTCGFGMYAYTGTGSAGTIAHGLGVAPELVIVKCLDADGAWTVWNKGLGGTQYMVMNTTAPASTNSNVFAAEPTDTVISLGNAGGVNGSPNLFIAYCFAPKKGFSKFGTYVGNLNDDGPFIYTGFRPAFTMTKVSETDSNSWYMLDRLRANPYNPQDGRLEADGSGTESTGKDIDYLANGFKIRKNDGGMNTSGRTYVYMAFAEFPLVSSNSKAGTAR
jgi:hypothetical protein